MNGTALDVKVQFVGEQGLANVTSIGIDKVFESYTR